MQEKSRFMVSWVPYRIQRLQSANAPLRSKKLSARGVLADGHRPRPTKIRVYAFQIMSATVRFAGTNGNTCVV
jgi:hypothetical protein